MTAKKAIPECVDFLRIIEIHYYGKRKWCHICKKPIRAGNTIFGVFQGMGKKCLHVLCATKCCQAFEKTSLIATQRH